MYNLPRSWALGVPSYGRGLLLRFSHHNLVANLLNLKYLHYLFFVRAVLLFIIFVFCCWCLYVKYEGTAFDHPPLPWKAMAAPREPGFPTLQKCRAGCRAILHTAQPAPHYSRGAVRLTQRLQGINGDRLASTRKRAQRGGGPLGSVKQATSRHYSQACTRQRGSGRGWAHRVPSPAFW